MLNVNGDRCPLKAAALQADQNTWNLQNETLNKKEERDSKSRKDKKLFQLVQDKAEDVREKQP